MKLKEAIKILTEHVKISKLDYLPDVRDATQLGIEALKRCRVLAQESTLWKLHPLPGETEE